MAGAQFNSGTYEIYWYKDQAGTPNSPQSPTTSMTQSPVDKSFSVKKTAALAIGALVARRAFNTFRSELLATTGNERLAMQINNSMKAVGYIGAIAVGGWAGAAAVAVDAVASSFTYFRDNYRNNTKAAIDRELKGSRVSISSGSVYYD